MDLNILWFILIAVLYTGFFVLEGFDFGVGMLLPFLGKHDTERRAIINTIGPHWDGNEVWLITAGGATFAAFPQWYATLFSGFYLPLFLVLMALILRGVSFEFRSKDDNPAWRLLWDWCAFGGSLVAALLFGVAFANLVRGVPIDANMRYTGGFFYLLNPYALLGGVAMVAAFLLHGAIYLSLKTTNALAQRAHDTARKLWLPVVIILALFIGGTYMSTDMVARLGLVPGAVPISAALTLLASGYFINIKRHGWAFVMTSLTITLSVLMLFTILYPRLMVSTLGYDLDIYNAASGQYTLTVMSVVAFIFVPIVLAYTAWTYRVFRQRVAAKAEELTY